jgi:nicotinamide-nucleotide amidase
VTDIHDRAELATRLISALSERGETVAFAESLTGGLLTAALVGVPGASAVLRGGVTAYATDLKHEVLGVDAGLLAQHGPVDPQVAVAMAQGIRGLMRADWGVATTGVAGPGPQDGVPAGRAFLGVSGPGEAGFARELNLAGDRSAVRDACVLRALELLEFALSRSPGRAETEQVLRRDR